MDLDMGMCEDCGMKPANVQLTQMIGEEVTNLNICEDCASKRGISITFNQKGDDDEFDENLPFDLNSEDEESGQFDLFEEEFDYDDEERKPNAPIKMTPPKPKEDPLCGKCGMRYSLFQETGVLGCPVCYTSFEEQISNMLNQIHGSTVHKGKNYRDKALKEEDIKTLKNELSSAIKNEEFELAAVIRDRIHSRQGR